MKLVIDTWRGVSINDGLNYVADFPEGAPLVNPSSPLFVEMLDRPSRVVGRRLSGSTISIFVQPQSAYRTKRETLRDLFMTEERFVYYPLIAHDEDDSNRVWSIQAAVITATPKDDAFIIVLAPQYPYWQSLGVNEEETFTASAQTKVYNVATPSPHKVHPVMTFTINAAKAGGYLYERWITFKKQFEAATGTFPYELTGGLDTASIVAAGKALASGYDFRVTINGTEVPRWLADFNTASTKVWVNLAFPKLWWCNLGAAIPAAGAIAEIQINTLPGNTQVFDTWPSSGEVVIGSEGFRYTGKDSVNYRLTGVTRAIKGTSMAAHAFPDGVYVQTLDIRIVYGNSDAVDPDYPDTQKPLLDLSASTNTHWVMTEFGSLEGTRYPAWTPVRHQISLSPETKFYTGDNDTEANPFTVAGMRLASYQQANVWRAETGVVYWQFTSPFKITAWSLSGFIRKTHNSWPYNSVIYEGPTYASSVKVHTVAAPVALNTWEAWTFTRVAAAANTYVILPWHHGSTAAVENCMYQWELASATIDLDAASTVPRTLHPEVGMYEYSMVVRNNTTGHELRVSKNVSIDSVVVIDTQLHTVTVDGLDSSGGVIPSNYDEWFQLVPGNNDIILTDTGLSSISLEMVGYAERRI
jgi:hypothetical protein